MQRRTLRQTFPLLSLLLGALLSIGLAACGGQASQQQHVTLTFSTWIGGDNDPYVSFISSFEKAHPNITIKYQNTPFTSYATSLQTKFSANNAPDIIGLQPGGFTQPFAKAGDLLDLSGEPWVSQVTASAKSASQIPSVSPTAIYGLPLQNDIGGVIYNTQIFSRLGLQVPMNWETSKRFR